MTSLLVAETETPISPKGATEIRVVLPGSNPGGCALLRCYSSTGMDDRTKIVIFRLNQRIRVTLPGTWLGHTGTVARFTYRRTGVWVRMDSWPNGLDRVFEDEDRRDWMMFNDDECEAI